MEQTFSFLFFEQEIFFEDGSGDPFSHAIEAPPEKPNFPDLPSTVPTVFMLVPQGWNVQKSAKFESCSTDRFELEGRKK
ncbi:MAG TPA: hypothetical protein VMG30_11780 [Acidobacteriota bacterium]|nr:hypothetical protein [Acidobacteriota bacterium]